ncbi:hypothetical protein JT358_12630 [Micrococcales bacterium 31B]|nr:hypothetical protein [Micrococcales bacterium 31B]
MAHLRAETLIDLAKGSIAPATAAVFNAHISRCRECYAAYLRETSVQRALSVADVPCVPSDLESRMLTRLAECGMPLDCEATRAGAPAALAGAPGALRGFASEVSVAEWGGARTAPRRRGTLVVAAAAAAGLTLAVYGGVTLYNNSQATPIRPPVAQVSVKTEVASNPGSGVSVPTGNRASGR